MKPLHHIQLCIIRALLHSDVMIYSSLKPDETMPNAQYSFHLRTLIADGLVSKTSQGYMLTPAGKEYANRLHPTASPTHIITQAKLSLLLVPFRTVDEQIQVLLYTRKKQPFYNRQWLISGKIAYGERVAAAAQHKLRTKTWLDGTVTLVWLEHVHVYDTSQRLLEDKHMYICRIDHIHNDTAPIDPDASGIYERVAVDAIDEYLQYPICDDVQPVIALARAYDGTFTFCEYTQTTGDF